MFQLLAGLEYPFRLRLHRTHIRLRVHQIVGFLRRGRPQASCLCWPPLSESPVSMSARRGSLAFRHSGRCAPAETCALPRSTVTISNGLNHPPRCAIELMGSTHALAGFVLWFSFEKGGLSAPF